MPRMDLEYVLVQELIYSKHAKRMYRLAPQRRGIGMIDLRYVRSEMGLHKHWMDHVGRKGRFSLQGRDTRGKFSRCIAIIRVSDNGIFFKDNRCALCVIIRNRQKNIPGDIRI